MAVAEPVRPGSVGWPWRYWARQFVWTGVDLIFPPQCAGCGQPGKRFCAACQGQIAHLASPLCDYCGYPAGQPGLCRHCRAGVTSLAPLAGLRFAGLLEGPLQKAIHHLKYRNDYILSDTLAVRLPMVGPNPAVPGTLVVPVPLAAERLRERGYNQAGLLARAFAELHGLPWAPSAARRIRHTPSQVGLSAAERRTNVASAFVGDPGIVRGRPIILVDDVCTTGATLSACGEALVSAGATTVWGLTLARALWPDGMVNGRLRHDSERRQRPE